MEKELQEQIIALREDIDRLTKMVAFLVKASEPKGPRFITRGEIIKEHGRTFYENMRVHVKPIRKVGRNGNVRFEISDYETYLKGRHRL